MAPGCAGSCYISKKITLCTLMETYRETEREEEEKKGDGERNWDSTVMELD